MIYRFFRLCRKFAQGAGRRYYRLVSYPHDQAVFPDNAAAMRHAQSRHYAAILAASGDWTTLNARARQCVHWHEEGRGGYIRII